MSVDTQLFTLVNSSEQKNSSPEYDELMEYFDSALENGRIPYEDHKRLCSAVFRLEEKATLRVCADNQK